MTINISFVVPSYNRTTVRRKFNLLKVRKSQKQSMVSSILPKKRTKLTILSKEDPQDSEFHSFFGRIEDSINCFRDLLTFTNRLTNHCTCTLWLNMVEIFVPYNSEKMFLEAYFFIWLMNSPLVDEI